MKKLLYLLILISTPAWCADHYFDNGASDNTLPCTFADPCDNFPGTTLDDASALSPGDTVNFMRDDTWEGAEANVIINSAGTAGNFITVQSYGTGANAKFAGGPIASGTWVNSSGSVWRLTGQTQSTTCEVGDGSCKSVSEGDNDEGLMRWMGLNNNLPAGTYCWTTSTAAGTACSTSPSATNVYVRRYSSGNPNTDGIRISSVDLSDFNPLVGGVNNSTRGKYVRFRDLRIVNSEDRGFTTYYDGNEVLNVTTKGSSRDGIVLDDNSTSSWLYYPVASYNATNGGGTGQGITIQAPSTGITGTGGARSEYEYNGQAGLDFLDYGPNNASQQVTLRTTGHENGISPNLGSSFDPNWYCDGCSEHFAYGNRNYDAGRGLAAVAGEAKYGVQLGSEHAATDPCENIQFINNYVVKANLRSFYAIHGTGADTIANIDLIYNTMVADEASATGIIEWLKDNSRTADNWKMRNNIWVGNSGYYQVVEVQTGTYLDADNNNFYMRGQASTSTTLFNTNFGFGTSYNLASWRTASGEDASSVYGDPAFVSEASRDYHLGGASAALNIGMTSPYTIYSWVPTEIQTDIGTAGIKGSTIAAGTEDNYAVAPDAGFHYDYASLTSANVEPTSLVDSATGDITISFTIPRYVGGLLYNGTVKVTLPTGYSWSSGSATTVSSSTISGTWTFGSSGQVGTFTRIWDANSEFYGSYSIIATNVQNPTSGTTGTYTVELTDSAGVTIMRDNNILGDTILPLPTGGTHLAGKGYIGKGFITK